MTASSLVEGFGHTADGRAAFLYTLQNDFIRVRTTDFGGSIVSVEAPDRTGRRNHILLGFDSVSEYSIAEGAFGALLGRNANRIAGGRFELDGATYELSKNEGDTTLHGGKVGFDKVFWLVEAFDASKLVLGYISPDGDQGFPGTVTVDVTYTATTDSLRLDYAATTDAPTMINLTTHIYFNPAGAGSVLPQLLQLNADGVTVTDAQQIPTGRIVPVAGTAFDVRAPRAIGETVDSGEPQMEIAHGYDHNFVLQKSMPGALEWAARLGDPEGGIGLELSTTQPGLQVYSTNNVKPGQFNAQGVEIRKRDGLALETQHFPDSPNQPAFPSTLLAPGGTFRSTTVFRFPQAGSPFTGGGW